MKKYIEDWFNINLKYFNEGDIIGISKIELGYQIMYDCSFISFFKGIVKAKIISGNPQWAVSSARNTEITARPTKCFLRNKREECYWFTKEGKLE